MQRKVLEPLIPFAQLKEVVAGLIAVPKAELQAAELARPKSSRRAKATGKAKANGSSL